MVIKLSGYLGPRIYFGASLQQQAHHVAVPSFGRDVQRRDVVLRERTRSVVQPQRREEHDRNEAQNILTLVSVLCCEHDGLQLHNLPKMMLQNFFRLDLSPEEN